MTISCRTAWTSAAALTLLTARGHAAEVYIGGGDNLAGALSGYLAKPQDWTWVRAHADGYYVNCFPFAVKKKAVPAGRAELLRELVALFEHKNVFYESEAEAYQHRVFDQDDKTNIDLFIASGLKVKYATCNGVFTDARYQALKWRGERPVLSMGPPWKIGGDITSDLFSAPVWRKMIDASDGAATDGPTGLWRDDRGDVRAGSYSSVKYAHAHKKPAMVMLSPFLSNSTGTGTGDNFLKIGKHVVQGHEDNDAMPDIWAVSYYAAQIQQYPVTPEQVNGAPAGTITGMAYYLLHHLRDPGRSAALRMREHDDLTPTSDGAVMQLLANSQAYEVELSNSSSWLDLIPVLRVSVTDPHQAWRVTFALAGAEVTNAMTSSGGLVFYKNRRLQPGSKQTLAMTVASRSGQTTAAPLRISFTLSPHPTEAAVTQTLVLDTQKAPDRNPGAGGALGETGAGDAGESSAHRPGAEASRGGVGGEGGVVQGTGTDHALAGAAGAGPASRRVARSKGCACQLTPGGSSEFPRAVLLIGCGGLVFASRRRAKRAALWAAGMRPCPQDRCQLGTGAGC
jgi:hypothetical protein